MRWKKAHHSRMMHLVSRHIYCTDGSSPTGPGWALIVIQMCLQARHSGIQSHGCENIGWHFSSIKYLWG